jgi:hypothetical protein
MVERVNALEFELDAAPAILSGFSSLALAIYRPSVLFGVYLASFLHPNIDGARENAL